MNKIAIVGFGNHVTKNILPAIGRLDEIGVESVYVRDTAKYENKALEYGVNVKNINSEVIDDVRWVYISTPISTHNDLIKKYLKLGKNVICEKPITSDLEKTKTLFELAEIKGVQLHEVCMYKYHKQYEHLSKTVLENIHTLKNVSVKFTIPHLSKSDIRYKKKLGGGALLDVGYYPISLLTSLFGVAENIKSTKLSEDDYDVDLFGVAIFKYKRFYCVAEWGIGLPYSNEVIVTTENKSIKYERIFSKPETYFTTAKIKKGFDCFDVDIGTDDQFANMFRKIILAAPEDRIDSAVAVIASSTVLCGLHRSECE